MANLREAFEYASQNPDSDFARNLEKMASSGALNIEAKKYGIDLTPFQPTPIVEEEAPRSLVEKTTDVLGGVGSGAIKGALSSVQGLGQLGLKGVKAVTGKDFGTEETFFEDPTALEAKGTAETIGKAGEQIAEFFIPGGVATKGKKAIDAIKATTKLGKVAQLGGKALIGATEMGGVSAIQSGGDLSETGVSAGIGAAFPILSRDKSIKTNSSSSCRVYFRSSKTGNTKSYDRK